MPALRASRSVFSSSTRGITAALPRSKIDCPPSPTRTTSGRIENSPSESVFATTRRSTSDSRINDDVREIKDDGAGYLGPFTSTRAAEDARTALYETVPLRQCTEKMTLRTRHSACALAELGKCGAPCEGRQSPEEYGLHVANARQAISS